jgi:hypothetical protein
MTGYNWWLEYNMGIFHATETARQQLRESGEYIRSTNVAGADSGSAYYQLSDKEFNEIYPCLPLKEILIQNKGLSTKKEREERRKM